MQKRRADPVHVYVEALNEGHLRIIYVIREECRREDDLTRVAKRTRFMPGVQNE